MKLQPYFGKTTEFPLEKTIEVKKGWVLGLSVPTWALRSLWDWAAIRRGVQAARRAIATTRINAMEFTPEARDIDPQRLLGAYHASSAALNLVRAFTQGGYASTKCMRGIRTSCASPRRTVHERLAREIDNALAFMKACGADPEEFRWVDFFASHEALVLDYERPLVRIDSRTGLPYSVSGHFLWVGERTRDLGGAHVQYASLIRNPVGVKNGP